MTVISLITDFGIKDGYVGVMKGVIWRICPDVYISDLSHMISPQNVREAALILDQCAPYFPEGSVHVVVVDPGVGGTRRPMAARLGMQYYVGPDNGIITRLLGRAERENWEMQFVCLDKPQYWLTDVSHTFHGRDIFAPSAAHLAAGVPLAEIGTAFTDPVRLALPVPSRTARGLRGEVIQIDHFGSASSNIGRELIEGRLQEKERIVVRVAGAVIQGVVDAFGERPEGELIALMSSAGYLSIAVVNGSAASKLGVKVGDPFEVDFPV
jgi:S-adenosylmethionine hydrolase